MNPKTSFHQWFTLAHACLLVCLDLVVIMYFPVQVSDCLPVQEDLPEKGAHAAHLKVRVYGRKPPSKVFLILFVPVIYSMQKIMKMQKLHEVFAIYFDGKSSKKNCCNGSML